jgi:Zn-dependent M28 family amino/carboxypeptidase
MLSYVGHRNHGTVDNASGVAAVLEAAAAIPPTARVGVLVTDAEELALAGSRAWARSRAPCVALNCDTVDDPGPLVVMYSRRRPARLLSLLTAAAAAAGERIRVLRLIPGILTDHVALADAGWETVTLSRGDLRTLRRVHTSRDSLDSMRGTGITSAARVLARTATELG